jgi:hypothetical protein
MSDDSRAGVKVLCGIWGLVAYGVRPTRALAQTGIPLSGSLKRFLFINLGEVEDQQCQLFEPGGRVLALPGASLRFIKKRFRTGEKGFGQQPVDI